MEDCPHLHEPTQDALKTLCDPLSWACRTCSSTDGLWCCLECGHVGCGRKAHLPALGGGHSKHHYQMSSGRKREQKEGGEIGQKQSAGSKGHEVCLDIVSKAVHCYVCDDYVLSDAPWLESLRGELEGLETREDSEQEDEMEVAVGGQQQVAAGEISPMIQPPVTPGCTGLRNLGNTCYMNSVLQMLSHCMGFRSFFRDFLRAAAPLSFGKGGRITRESTIRLRDAVQLHETPDKLALTEATHALLRVLWSGRWASVAPRSFVHAVWTHGGLFAARRQQDAAEFLGFVLDRLDEEVKAKAPPKDAVSPSKQPSPILTDLFGIDQCQEVKCGGCGTVTKLTEPLLGLVLSLPDKSSPEGQKKKRKFKIKMKSKAKGDDVSLEACLDTLLTDEELVGDNKFFCDTCGGKQDATKTVALRRRPQALLLSFRRTRWNLKMGLHKDERKVAFPLELDATELLGEASASSSRNEEGGAAEECHYSLSSIVSHSGSSPLCGHYIAWCRVNNNGADSSGSSWHLFNDSTVSSATENEVLQSEAFILLYERRQHSIQTSMDTTL